MLNCKIDAKVRLLQLNCEFPLQIVCSISVLSTSMLKKRLLNDQYIPYQVL